MKYLPFLLVLLIPNFASATTVSFTPTGTSYYTQSTAGTPSRSTWYFQCPGITGLGVIQDAFSSTNYGILTAYPSGGTDWYSADFPQNGYVNGNGFNFDVSGHTFHNCGATVTFDTNPPAGGGGGSTSTTTLATIQATTGLGLVFFWWSMAVASWFVFAIPTAVLVYLFLRMITRSVRKLV